MKNAIYYYYFCLLLWEDSLERGVGSGKALEPVSKLVFCKTNVLMLNSGMRVTVTQPIEIISP